MSAPPVIFPAVFGVRHAVAGGAPHTASAQPVRDGGSGAHIPGADHRAAAASLSPPTLSGHAASPALTLRVATPPPLLAKAVDPAAAELAAGEAARPPAGPVATREPWGRDLTKTITFLVLHLLVGFTVAFIFTGDIAVAGGIALVEPLVNAVVFFFHERAWRRTDVPLLDILTHRHTREA